MAVKKRAKKKAVKKSDPLASLKQKLVDIKANLQATKAQTKETAKRIDAFMKENLSVKAPAPATKKKAVKRRKKRVAKKK